MELCLILLKLKEFIVIVASAERFREQQNVRVCVFTAV